MTSWRQVVLLMGLVAACGDEPVAPRGPLTLALGADLVELSPGESLTVAVAAYYPDNGPFYKPWLRWESSDPAIATVDSTGRIVALVEGTAMIRVHTTPSLVADSVVLRVRRSFTAIAAGLNFSCGIAVGGKLWCWGDNSLGALGIGRDSRRGSPVPPAVAGKRTWRAVNAQQRHACAITAASEAYCWGASDPSITGGDGVFGDGRNSNDGFPSRVWGVQQWRSIAPGTNTTCGVAWSYDAWCWGRDNFGALGFGTFDGHWSPGPVAGGAQYSEVGAGGFTGCGLTHGGSVHCWGLGNGPSPVPVPGGHVFVDLAVGRDLVCALTGRGDSWCWGVSRGNLLGKGAPDTTFRPLAMARMPLFSNIAASTTHVCGLEQRTGRAFCWGSNRSGELGRPDDGSGFSYDALPVEGGHSFVQIAVGNGHTCGVTAGGGAWCWGAGTSGQLGDGMAKGGPRPRRVRHPG